MQAKKINPSQMSQIIAEQLNLNPESVFVFSSDVAANSWAEWCVKNPDGIGGVWESIKNFGRKFVIKK